jgi:hypothetical protein
MAGGPINQEKLGRIPGQTENGEAVPGAREEVLD